MGKTPVNVHIWGLVMVLAISFKICIPASCVITEDLVIISVLTSLSILATGCACSLLPSQKSIRARSARRSEAGLGKEVKYADKPTRFNLLSITYYLCVEAIDEGRMSTS